MVSFPVQVLWLEPSMIGQPLEDCFTQGREDLLAALRLGERKPTSIHAISQRNSTIHRLSGEMGEESLGSAHSSGPAFTGHSRPPDL